MQQHSRQMDAAAPYSLGGDISQQLLSGFVDSELWDDLGFNE